MLWECHDFAAAPALVDCRARRLAGESQCVLHFFQYGRRRVLSWHRAAAPSVHEPGCVLVISRSSGWAAHATELPSFIQPGPWEPGHIPALEPDLGSSPDSPGCMRGEMRKLAEPRQPLAPSLADPPRPPADPAAT